MLHRHEWKANLLFIINIYGCDKLNGGRKMAKCKNCGAEVAKARKQWKMAGRPDKAGKRTQLTIGLFDCPSCNKSFKVVLNKQKI